MKSLTTLIRLQKQELDSQRLVVTALESEIAKTEQAQEKLAAEIVGERYIAGKQAAESVGLDNYLARAKKRTLDLAEKKKALQMALIPEQDKLSLLFEGLKRYEIALANAQAAEAAEAARQERIMLDEIGQTQFQRNSKREDGQKKS